MSVNQPNFCFEPGARWLRCDLHVHTPFDTEKEFGEEIQQAIEAFGNENPQRLFNIAKRFVNACGQAANGEGLGLVAITDHNSIDGYRYLKPQFDNLAQNIEEEELRMPVILPGVEFSVGGERPIHVLVIFSSDTCVEDIEKVIDHVFGSRDPFHPQTRIPLSNGESVSTFLDRLHRYCRPDTGERNLQFVVLPAHADGSRGLARETGVRSQGAGGIWDQMRGHLRQQVVARKDWDGFQTSKSFTELPLAFKDLLSHWEATRRGDDWDGLSKDEKRRFENQEHWSLVEGSDPHKYEIIGTRFSWLKMEIPDVEGIRIALLDTQSRLRRMDAGPPIPDYPHLKRITVRNTDFFEEIEIPVSPCLTTLIGGRGSGKSTVIEYLRHAMDRDREVDLSDGSDNVFEAVQSILSKKSDRDFGHSKGTLLTDYQISVEIAVAGRFHRITRSSSGITSTQRVDQQNSQSVTLDVRSLIAPRILSQRQIAQIARDPASQRRELDTLIDDDRLRDIKERQRALTDTLSQYQLSRKRLTESRDSSPALITKLQKVRDQISFFEKEEHMEVLTHFGELEQERRWIDDAVKEVEGIEFNLVELAESIEELGVEAYELSALKSEEAWLYSVADRIRNARDAAASALRKQSHVLHSPSEHIRSDQVEKWQPSYNQTRSEYDALIDVMKSEGVRLANHEKLLQERAQLERKESLLQNVGQELDQVEERIKTAHLALQRTHEERFEARKELAQALEDMDADVRLSILAFGDRNDFEARREQWFGGAGLQERDWRVLCDYVFSSDGEVPSKLRELLKALRTDINTSSRHGRAVVESDSRVASLVEHSGLTKHFFNALQRRNSIRLDEMESFLPEDLVQAQVRAKDGTFKTIETGSVGEKSTAIVSLLLSAGDQPIVIDQPEDDLDNQYVYNVVVDLVRHQKFKRQIIIATHNANIPVNGDAELIIALGATDRVGKLLLAGSIDRPAIKGLVTTIMEGGAEAFRLRRQRYGY